MKKIKYYCKSFANEVRVSDDFDLTQSALAESARNKWVDQEVINREYLGITPAWYIGEAVYNDGKCIVRKNDQSYEQRDESGSKIRYEIAFNLYIGDEHEGDPNYDQRDYIDQLSRDDLKNNYNVLFDDEPDDC